MSGTLTAMNFKSNAPIVVNLGILIAIVVGVFQVGRAAERAETRLDGIENGVKNLTDAVNVNGVNVQGVTSRLNAIDTGGTRWSIDQMSTIQARLLLLETCLKQGKRKCLSE